MSVEFDTYRENYRSAVGESIGFIRQDVDFFAEVKATRLLELCRRRVGDPSGLELLDVGCGVGVTDAHLAGRVARLHGVDITPGVIEEARAANPDAAYQVYDGKRLPFDDCAVDVAFAICVVHHVPPPDWPRFTAEMARVVKPGGLAVFVEHNPLNPLTRLAVSRCEFDEHAVLLRRRTSKLLMRESGLEVVEARYMTFFPFWGDVLRPVERALGWLPAGAQYYVAGTR